MSIGDILYIEGDELGKLADAKSDRIIIKNKNSESIPISVMSSNFNKITSMPF